MRKNDIEHHSLRGTEKSNLHPSSCFELTLNKGDIKLKMFHIEKESEDDWNGVIDFRCNKI